MVSWAQGEKGEQSSARFTNHTQAHILRQVPMTDTDATISTKPGTPEFNAAPTALFSRGTTAINALRNLCPAAKLLAAHYHYFVSDTHIKPESSLLLLHDQKALTPSLWGRRFTADNEGGSRIPESLATAG